MPLTEYQRRILALLAKNRDPNSYVAGGAVVNRLPDSPRFSEDIDIFHDAAEAVREAFHKDHETLTIAGFKIAAIINEDSFVRAIVSDGSDSVKLDWARDSAFRFFKVQADPEMGFVLHPVDIATNKVLALAGRFEARDFVDLNYLHHEGMTLGLIVWAACGKDPGLTPALILDQCRRFSRLSSEALCASVGAFALDFVALRADWFNALEEAEEIIRSLPPEELGTLYVDREGKVADPRVTSDVQKIPGSLGGAIPRVAAQSEELSHDDRTRAVELLKNSYGIAEPSKQLSPDKPTQYEK
jgi:hypothetical protein